MHLHYAQTVEKGENVLSFHELFQKYCSYLFAKEVSDAASAVVIIYALFLVLYCYLNNSIGAIFNLLRVKSLWKNEN